MTKVNISKRNTSMKQIQTGEQNENTMTSSISVLILFSSEIFGPLYSTAVQQYNLIQG
jgi:hypothetical protein